MEEKKTIAFDFDGVIHRYSKGWDDGSIYDKPVDGIKETIDQLREEGFEVVIYSTRAKSTTGIQDMKKWLKKYKIEIDDIATDKPIALMYVDDRAVPFNGNCETLLKNIHGFKTWIEKRKKTCAYCGKEFENTARGGQKYCDIECKVRAQIQNEIEKKSKPKTHRHIYTMDRGWERM